MKNYILLGSLGAAIIATIFGVSAVFSEHTGYVNGEVVERLLSTARLYQLAGISGLLSIGSFFVGLAYPTTTTVTTSLDTVSQTETRRVVNN